jgi:hypothetical protein
MNIFIAGMEKCGTTALAHWMITNNLAKYLVPNVKEPYIYAHKDPNLDGISLVSHELPLLDASVGYSLNPSAIQRLPKYDSKIIICLKNQFERTWSSYKMQKLITNNKYASLSINLGPLGEKDSLEYFKTDHALDTARKLYKYNFPRQSNSTIDKYFEFQVQNFNNQSFEERIQFEISFFLRRRQFPFLSILNASFYYFPLKNLMREFIEEDITLININRINKYESPRRNFVKRIFQINQETTDIAERFSLSNLSIDEDKPDFCDSKFDILRSYFQEDQVEFYNLISENKLYDEWVDRVELSNFIV